MDWTWVAWGAIFAVVFLGTLISIGLLVERRQRKREQQKWHTVYVCPNCPRVVTSPEPSRYCASCGALNHVMEGRNRWVDDIWQNNVRVPGHVEPVGDWRLG